MVLSVPMEDVVVVVVVFNHSNQIGKQANRWSLEVLVLSTDGRFVKHSLTSF